MGLLGADFTTAKNSGDYGPVLGVGVFGSIGIAIGVFAFYSVVQAVIGLVIAARYLGNASELPQQVQGMILATLPAACVAALAAYFLAGIGKANKRDVLSLRLPRITLLGWVALVVAFIVGLYLLLTLVTVLLGIDPAQYTPKPDGTSPKSGSAGLVKEAMFALSNDPKKFWIAFASVSLGAPLAEEFIFRGQLFAALAQSRVGRIGAVAISSVLWASLHLTEPWLAVGLIVIMGFVLGWMLIRFRSLFVTMVCHGAWNAAYSLLIHYNT